MYPQHSRNTPHVTKNNSTIFKTITSSVDESRQTLALFNKDWETYKRNWQNANGIGGKLGSIFTPANAITKSDIEAIKAYNSQIDACVTSQTAFNRTMLNASPAAQNLVASYNGGKVSAQGMATAQNAAKASTIGLTIAQTALNAAIGMGIGLLINLVVQGVNKLIHANEEAIEKAEELRNKYEEFKNTNASNVSTLKGLESEFKELSKGVSQYGDNISLTTEQYERYKEIIQQIVGMSPSLAEGYDTENGYIADKNGLLERAIELQEIEYRNELRKITNLENLKTSMSGYIAEYKDALNGGIITAEGNIVGTTIDTDFKNSLWQLFNTNNRENYDGQSMAKDIMESLGIKDIDAEMQKYFNEYGYWQDSWFWNDYCDTIINNLNAVTDSLSFEEVGLDEEVFDQNLEKLESYAESYRDMKDSVEMANNAIQTDLGYIAEYANGYSKLSTEQQKFVADFLKGFNISDITSENAFGSLEYDNDKMASVKSQIKKFVEELSQDESTKEALEDLYAIPTDEQSISEFVEQFRSALEIIKAYCEENGIEIPIAITDSEKEINELEAQYQRAVDYTKDKFDGYDPTAFFKENSINTQEEVDKWLEIAQAANSAAEAEEQYISSLYSHSIDILPISSTIDQLNTRLKPAMDSLKSTWQDIFTDDGLSLDNLDLLSTVDSIKSKLDELNKIDGITVDYSSFEDFVRILENTESTEENVKQGFNELAKSIVQASVSGIEDFQTLKDVLEDLGVVNNEIVAFQALAQNTDALKASGLDLLNATQSDIEAFASKRVSVENLSEAIIYLTEQQKYLQFQTEINSFQSMDTSQEIANLKNLAKNAGITGDVISDLTELEQIYQAVASGVYGINTQQVAMAMERAKQLKNKIQEEISNENLKTPEIEFPEVKFEPKIDKSSAKKSADDLEKLTKDYVDAYMNYMEQSLKTGRIDYQTYARDVARFLKDMYDQGKIAAKDYHDYTKEMLEVQKNVYDKALSAITRRLEKESEYYQGLIDEINKKNDSLEKQKDDYDSILSVVEKVYDKEIEALQEQQKAIDEKIDALRDANDEEERGIALANARYALEKAQQQRTRLVYTEGEGFIYKQDNEAIREARKELKDVELENTISQLEKEKEALDEDIENLEKYKDLWSEIPDLYQQAVNEKLAIDMFGADYEKVILQSREQAINEFANKYISIQQQVDDNNSLIESYEEKKEYYDKLREQWNDLADVYEQSVEDQYAAMLYGVDWEDQILSGRIDYLNDFKDSYIEIQQAIVDAAWNSANEQVKAAKEAAKGADGNTNDITSLGLKKELDKNVEPNSKFNVTYGTTNPSEFEQKLNDVKKYGSLVVVESKKNNNNTNKLDEYYEKLKRGSKYASGTKNAKKGLNLVGEEGTETFVDNDGNVSLVTEPTLIPMKGGETVIKASETEKILTGIDNLVPLNWDEMWNKIKISPQAMPKFDLNIPDYSKMLSNAKSQDVSITQHIELTLPNVTNTSGVENVIETIRKLPLDALQYVNRR